MKRRIKKRRSDGNSEGAYAGESTRGGALPGNPGAKRLGWILGIVVTGFFLSTIYHYEMGFVHRQPYPICTFLFRPLDQLTDLFDNFKVGQELYTNPKHNDNLFPLNMVRSRLLYVLFFPTGAHLAWFISTAIFLAALFYLARKTISTVSPDCAWAKTVVLTLCSYPVLFSLDRSNFENTIFIWLATAVVLYQRGRFLWAAAVFGAAIAVKPYNLVFVALFLSDRKFKEVFVAGCVALGLTLLSLWVLPEPVGEQLHGLAYSLSEYNRVYVNGNEGLYFGSSLYGLAKVFIYWNHWFLEGANPDGIYAFRSHFMSIYFRFSVIVFGGIVVLLCVFRMEYWKRIALLVCSMNLLPYVCGDYRLLHLFIPLFLFILVKDPAWGDRLFAAIFGLLLIPTGYIRFAFDPVFDVSPEASDSIIVHPLLMVLLVVGITWSVLRSPRMSDTGLWLLGILRRSGLAPRRVSTVSSGA